MLGWTIWFGCGVVAGFKKIDDKFIKKFHDQFSYALSREAILFIAWFFHIVLGGLSLVLVIFDDIKELLIKKK